MSSPSDSRFAELEAQVASLKTQLAEQREMLATFVLPPELLRASSKGMKGMVEKLLAAGAKAENTKLSAEKEAVEAKQRETEEQVRVPVDSMSPSPSSTLPPLPTSSPSLTNACPHPQPNIIYSQARDPLEQLPAAAQVGD